VNKNDEYKKQFVVHAINENLPDMFCA